MNIKYYIELVILAALWEASFLFLRIATPEFGPLPLIAIRTGITAIFLMPFMFAAKQCTQLVENLKPLFMLGLISTAIPYSLFSYTTLHATAGYTSILNASTPMFAAVVAWFWIKEYLSAFCIAGILIGFTGVAVLVFDNESIDVNAGLLPILAALFASFLYAITGSYTKSRFSKMSPLATAVGSLISSSIVLLPFAIYFWPTQVISNGAWLSLVALSVVCTAIACILYFRLILSIGVAKTVSVTYLIPVFGILWGNLFLGEKITLNMLFGGILILVGIGLTTGLVKSTRRIQLVSDRKK